MSVIAGYDPQNGKLCLYDSETQITTNIEITKLLPEDFKDIDNVVKEIKSKNVDSLCGKLYGLYKNNFRKHFFKAAKNYGLTNVTIIGVEKLLLIGGIMQMNNTSLSMNGVCIFYFDETFIYCIIWENNKNIVWKFVNYFKHNIAANNNQSSVEDLKSFKNKIKNPDSYDVAFIYRGTELVNENEFKTIFPAFKDVFYLNHEWSVNAANYARFLSRDKNCGDFKVEEILQRSVYIKQNGISLIEAPLYLALPLKKSGIIPKNTCNKIKIFEGGEMMKELTLRSDKDITISLSIDTNEIYTINLNYATVCVTNKSIAYLNTLLDDPVVFPATVNFNETLPQVGIQDTGDSITNIMDILGQEITPKLTRCPMKRIYCRGFPELFFYFYKSQTLVNAKSVLAELLKEVVRKVGPNVDTYYLTVPRYFNQKQRREYKIATIFGGMPKANFVDEMTALAFGYKEKFNVESEETFAILHFSAFNFTAGLFNSKKIDDKDAFFVVLDMGDFDYTKANFYDEIILNGQNNIENNLAPKDEFVKAIDNINKNGLSFISTIESLYSVVITDAWVKDVIDYHYPNEKIVYIEEYSSLAALGAQQCPILEE